MRKIILEPQVSNIISIKEINDLQFYLLTEEDSSYFCLLVYEDSDASLAKWYDLSAGCPAPEKGHPLELIKEALETNSVVYEFDTMQELLEYYLEQIKKK